MGKRAHESSLGDTNLVNPNLARPFRHPSGGWLDTRADGYPLQNNRPESGNLAIMGVPVLKL